MPRQESDCSVPVEVQVPIEVQVQVPSTMPRYMMPNFSSILPEYANEEADLIKHAFSVGNFQSITKIPDKIKTANQRQREIRTKIQKKKESNASKIVTSCGLFSQFEYIPTKYGLVEELERMVRKI